MLQKLEANGNLAWRSFRTNEIEPPFLQSWGAHTFGLLVIVDAKGIVRGIFRGKDLDTDDVEQAIRSLINQ